MGIKALQRSVLQRLRHKDALLSCSLHNIQVGVVDAVRIQLVEFLIIVGMSMVNLLPLLLPHLLHLQSLNAEMVKF
jgi:hypothetical protein